MAESKEKLKSEIKEELRSEGFTDQSCYQYISSSRRIARFKDKPSSPDDVEIKEWVQDIKAHLNTRKFKDREEAAAFIVSNLAGKARKEIIGRGIEISTNPEKIFEILIKVFGDGDILPVLQQRFYEYKQGSKEDLLSCSLKLVELFDEICVIREEFLVDRDNTLKGRLAECVRDNSLKRELRRLNLEQPRLSFFDLRDRAIDWIGRSDQNQKETGTLQESAVQNDEILKLVQEQSKQIAQQSKQILQQQQQINELMRGQFRGQRDMIREVRGRGQSRGRGRHSNRYGRQSEVRKCFKCGSEEHLLRNCPQNQDF
ncbi:uncharacterized protein LOC106175855 [Lingula anatina]|uniref:Uncharacterized protein LOC106175855 n=1 Tax=Lingula anatina TaxID=7574 RepID=A0A1S3JT16_LINAN|nr:uncharacterized protein LOC106175855 [Lingula anatina]|eukprot:XP_013413467.1 uncharacterized protein LOC106175855 [Lingula anatina]